MDKLMDEIGALVRESGGGGEPLETIAAQGIKGIALFLGDGSVAVIGAAKNGGGICD